MQSDAVDIYLYAPQSSTPVIHLWEKVANSEGNYEGTLKPKWWNSTATVSLQLRIVESGSPPYMASLPPGPLFNATYAAPTSGSTPAQSLPRV